LPGEARRIPAEQPLVKFLVEDNGVPSPVPRFISLESIACGHNQIDRSAHMAAGSRTTFKKRQKEMARVEKQRDKAAKRAQKKESDRPSEPEVMSLDEAQLLRSS
jgi:hypothetical protein